MLFICITLVPILDGRHYEADLLLVKYGEQTIATYKEHDPEGSLVFDCGASISWFSESLWLATLRAVSHRSFLQIETSFLWVNLVTTNVISHLYIHLITCIL